MNARVPVIFLALLVGCVKRTYITPAAGGVNDNTPSVNDAYQRALAEIKNAKAELQLTVRNAAPVGSIVAWAGEEATIPQGWMICNGAPLDQKEFSELYAVLKSRYGASSNTFNLPDYRGWFLRGVSQSSGHDPDAATRTALPGTTSTVKGDDVGTFQDMQIQSHRHGMGGNGSIGQNAPYFNNGQQDNSNCCQTWPAGGSETRPRNVSVYWIIHVKS